MSKPSKSMWVTPWGYKEAVVVALGIVFAGLLLQITVGSIDSHLFSFPANLIADLFFMFILVIVHLSFSKSSLIVWLRSTKIAITLSIVLGIVVILMGLTPQQTTTGHPVAGVTGLLGLNVVIHTWYFAFVFIMLLTSLGLTILNRIFPFSIRNIGFTLNHLGLWITLLAGVSGSGDLARMTMSVNEGKVEWRVKDSSGQVYEMPLAIELKDFRMDEYPGKLLLIDTRTGENKTSGKHKFFDSSDTTSKGILLDWEITVKKHFADAGYVTADKYAPVNIPGACQASYIVVRRVGSSSVKKGWVSSGSFIYPPKVLYLDSTTAVAMAEPEPRKYASYVSIYTKKGASMDTVIEVNRPVEVEGWKLYQLGYDDTKGKWSALSTIELVKDPWIGVVYTGLLMLLGGAVFMFWNANRLKMKSYDVE